MSIYVRVSGGKVVHRVTERLFAQPPAARSYLAEFKLPDGTSGRVFKHRDLKFELSHAYEDVLTHDTLPDNDVSSGAALRLARENAPMPLTPRSTVTSKNNDNTGGTSITPQTSSPSPAKASRSAQSGEKMVCLKELCQKLKMEPRTARQKLRKHFQSADKQRWEWPAAEAEEILKVLQR